LQVGDYPFCDKFGGPHGRAVTHVIDDQLEGGPRRFWMLEGEPYIETKSQWRREVDKRGLVHVSRHDRAYHKKKFKEHDERLRDERV
jgi:hypothetical protein